MPDRGVSLLLAIDSVRSAPKFPEPPKTLTGDDFCGEKRGLKEHKLIFLCCQSLLRFSSSAAVSSGLSFYHPAPTQPLLPVLLHKWCKQTLFYLPSQTEELSLNSVCCGPQVAPFFKQQIRPKGQIRTWLLTGEAFTPLLISWPPNVCSTSSGVKESRQRREDNPPTPLGLLVPGTKQSAHMQFQDILQTVGAKADLEKSFVGAAVGCEFPCMIEPLGASSFWHFGALC